MALLAAALLPVVWVGSADASSVEAGIQVTIHDASGSLSPPLIGGEEIAANVDFEPQDSYPNGPQLAGMSPLRLLQLVGVDPASLDPTIAMTIAADPASQAKSTNAALLPNPDSLSRSEVTDGFSLPAGSPARYAVFGQQGGAYGFEQPEDPGGPFNAPYADFSSSPVVPFEVDVYLDAFVLGVPQPAVVCPARGAASQAVQFSVDPEEVTLGIASGAGVDSNGLTYSWDFGDGKPVTGLLSPSSSHTYPSSPSGTYDVRVTVSDAAGNTGVSTVPAQVEVSSAGPICGGGDGGGGSFGAAGTAPAPSPGGGKQSDGGGNGAAKTLSSGAANGSILAPISAVSPRTTGAPAPSKTGSGSSAGGAPGSGSATRGGGRGGGGSGAPGSAGGAGGGDGSPGGAGRGSAASAGSSGDGAGRVKSVSGAAVGPPTRAVLTGILLDSYGEPLALASLSSVSNPLSVLQSVARRSAGGGGRGAGLPAWLLGVAAVLGLLASGIVREAGPRAVALSRRHLHRGRPAVPS